MTVYITKVWGFSAPVGPLQFSLSGWRERARDILRPGDRVILVGTMGSETAEADHNRILGMMEPTTDAVSSLDYNLARGPGDFEKGGRYKWPYGLTTYRHPSSK